jgi:hypothetical protein
MVAAVGPSSVRWVTFALIAAHISLDEQLRVELLGCLSWGFRGPEDLDPRSFCQDHGYGVPLL